MGRPSVKTVIRDRFGDLDRGIQYILDRRRDGTSWDAIAEDFGVSRNSIVRFLDNFGGGNEGRGALGFRPKQERRNLVIKLEEMFGSKHNAVRNIYAMADELGTIAAVAEKLGAPYPALQQFLHRMRLEREEERLPRIPLAPDRWPAQENKIKFEPNNHRGWLDPDYPILCLGPGPNPPWLCVGPFGGNRTAHFGSCPGYPPRVIKVKKNNDQQIRV